MNFGQRRMAIKKSRTSETAHPKTHNSWCSEVSAQPALFHAVANGLCYGDTKLARIRLCPQGPVDSTLVFALQDKVPLARAVAKETWLWVAHSGDLSQVGDQAAEDQSRLPPRHAILAEVYPNRVDFPQSAKADDPRQLPEP